MSGSTTDRVQDMGDALQHLACTLDGLLLAEPEPSRDGLRRVRLQVGAALCALAAVDAELHHARWKGPLDEDLRAIAAVHEEATGATSVVRVRGSLGGLAPDRTDALRRVAIEVVGSVCRHARGSYLLLALDAEHQRATLDIVDDGVDLERRQVAAWGSRVEVGLWRARQALRPVGGSLHLHPLRPRGLRVRATVPTSDR